MSTMELDGHPDRSDHALLSGDEPTAKMPSVATLLDFLAAEGRYKIFGMALKETGLDERLRGSGPFTVFAPTDEAFQRVPHLAELLKATERLRAVLLRHLIWGDLDAQALWGLETLMPLDGEALRITKETFRIEGAEVVQANVQAPNGKIHGVNQLFMEESVSALREAGAAVEASVNSSAAYMNEKLEAGVEWLQAQFHPDAQKQVTPAAEEFGITKPLMAVKP